MKLRYVLSFGLLLAIILPLYQNCGESELQVAGNASRTAGGNSGGGSSGSGEDGPLTDCDGPLVEVFRNTYRPFLGDSTLCARCHTDNGRSPIKFASANETTAYNAFMTVGVEQADANAVDATHAPGVTGPGLQTRVAAIRPAWDVGFEEYVACRNESGGSISTSVHTIDKLVPELYFGDGRQAVTVSWMMNSTEARPAGGRFPAELRVDIEIQYGMVEGVEAPIGYRFTNPRIAMFSGEIEVEVQGIIVSINGIEITTPSMDPFQDAVGIVRGIDFRNIFTGSVNAPMQTVSSSDRFSLALRYIQIRPRTDNPPIPNPPTLTTAAFTNQGTIGVNISNDGSARRWCLTSSPNRPPSTNDACPLSPNGWTITRPNNFSLASLATPPTSGQSVTIYLWIANSDLKINTTPATATFTFDDTLPVAPTLASVSLAGGTQIGDLVGLGDTNEQVTWCVRESGSQAGAEDNNGCNFTNTKPTLVGLRQNGTRWIAVHVRDRAGNDARSPARSVNNILGRISYVQLTSAPDARAVFQNRCQSCHGAGMPRQGLWDETSYSDTVAKENSYNGLSTNGIKNRIRSTTNPMPPASAGGPLPERERMLIELWYDQTGTPLEL